MSDVYFTRCYAPHIRLVQARIEQKDDRVFMLRPEILEVLASNSFAISAHIAGRCVGAAGVVNLWPGRDACWMLLSDIKSLSHRNKLSIIRKIKAVLDVWPTPRVEASVLCDFEAGHRFARVLGFVCEAECMKGYHLGKDASLYARVK